MKSKLLLTVLFLGTILFRNQAQELDLSNNIIGYQEPLTKILGQTAGDDGNIYYWGIFKGALVIDGEVKALGKGGTDFFVAITDMDGNFQKAYTYGGENSEIGGINAINSQKSILVSGGNIYLILNSLAVGAKIETSTGTLTVSENGIKSIFLKIDASTGTILFAKTSTLLFQRIFKDHNEIFFQGDFLTGTSYQYGGETFEVGEVIPRNGVFIFKTNLNGDRIWLKIIKSSSVLRMEDVEFDGNGRIVFAFYSIAEDFTINKKPFNYPISFQGRNLFIAASDTELDDVTVKLIYRQTKSGNWIQGIDIGVESSVILFYFRDPEKFTFESSESNYQRNHVLLQIGKQFELKQITTLTSFANLNDVIRFNSIKADENYIYLNGFYFGRNTSSYDIFNPAIKSVNVFKDKWQNFDANGPSKNILIKTDLSLSAYNVIELGSLTRLPKPDVLVLPVVSQGRYLNIDWEDEIWNPWFLNANNQVVKGIMSGSSDKADESFAVQYLDDGSRIVLGFALGYTMLDDFNDESIGKNKSLKDLFIMRIDGNNKLIWYKRLKSTFGNSKINSLKKIGNKIYAIATFSNSATRFLNDIFILDDKVIVIESNAENNNADMHFVIDSEGIKDFSEVLLPPNISISLFQATGKTFIDESTFLEYNLGQVNKSLTIGSKTFSNAQGFYFSLVNKNSLERLNAIKLSFLSTIIPFSISGVEYSKENEALLISTVGSFLQTSPDFVDLKIEFSSGSEQVFRINKNQFVAQNPSATVFGLVLNVSWSEINWMKQFGSSCSNVMAKYLADGRILVYGTRNDKYLAYADITPQQQTRSTQVIFQDDAAAIFRPYVLTFSAAGVIERQKSFNEPVLNTLGNAVGSKLSIANIKEFNNDLYVIGSNNGSFQSDGVEVGFLKLPDALVIQMSRDLVVKNIYRIASNFTERMLDCDVFGDKISFVYSSQGNPTLLQGNNFIQNNAVLSSIYPQTANYRLDLLSQANTAISPSLSLDQVNPLDKDENAGQGQYNLCKEITWYRDADGDGFGNKNISSLHCEKPIGYVSNALDCDDTEFASTPCPCPIRTFSNDWASNAISPLNDQWFSGKYPFGLTIGDVTGKAYSVKFTSAVSVKKFISNSNQPYVLTRSYENPSSKDLRNNLANQVLFLEMNIRYNPGLKRSVVKSGTFLGQTVKQIFEEANLILSGQKLVNKSALGAICDVVEKINGSYESGKSSGFLNCTTSSFDGLTSSANLSANKSEATLQKDKKVPYSVYPNPSNTSFTYRSSATMMQEISIFNSVGQLMEKLVYRPQENLIFGSSYKSGIYYLRVSDKDSGDLLRVIKR
jgi:hypothetical protein